MVALSGFPPTAQPSALPERQISKDVSIYIEDSFIRFYCAAIFDKFEVSSAFTTLTGISPEISSVPRRTFRSTPAGLEPTSSRLRPAINWANAEVVKLAESRRAGPAVLRLEIYRLSIAFNA
ncbi:hypothetical protein EVAR_4206_1 [Eumeta japonica]|uniref:Uncharacterized protein n=1 Tax=Eumeta variegata TaxID=151549 RepID=A0A4C1TJI0_EUMVA|nr:hypothetical protein EVAR_4206_1 [Eumeta japonica]